MYQRSIIIGLLIVIPLSSALRAQITIGSDSSPEKGALLQLKTDETGNQPSVTTNKEGGGLLLPRIELKNKNDLFFISNTDPRFGVTSLRHTGLLVYNLKTTADGLKPGMYVWNGAEWISTANEEKPEPLWLMTGNRDVDISKHFLGTTSGNTNPLQVKTNNTNRIYIDSNGKISLGTGTGIEQASANLHVFGNMKLKSAPLTANAEVLGVNNTTTEIGRVELPVVKTKALFAQSGESQQMPQVGTKNKIDDGEVITVTWKTADWDNNLNNDFMTFNSSDNSFQFGENALCAISGYVNYVVVGESPDGNFLEYASETLATLEVAMQLYQGGQWKDISLAVGVWEWVSTRNICQTVIIPHCVRQFNKNEKIRMVVRRQKDGAKYFGLNHYYKTDGNYIPRIEAPTGSKFSKGIKIRQIKGIEYP